MTSFPIAKSSKMPSVPLVLLDKKHAAAWTKKQPAFTRQWLQENRFTAEPSSYCLIPDKNGVLSQVICGIDGTGEMWSLAHLPPLLPVRRYHLDCDFLSAQQKSDLCIGWALAGYRFARYKKQEAELPILTVPEQADMRAILSMAEAIGWGRDMINTPANDMHPAALAAEAVQFAEKSGGKARTIKGDALLKANYPLIYTVGKAAEIPPHLVDILYAKKGAPKVTLVGKGVCFDSGGLDIKGAANMKLMKKDMGGAACVLALAKMLVEAKLPIQLRVLLPIVENAVAGNAMRPLDIVRSRKGITVEIGNTDAEGRLILCDALFEADEEQPDLLIDCATLTGAARVALGTDVPAFFTPDDALADELLKHSRATNDPLWRLPLFSPYRKLLNTPSADISNDPDSAYGGAITAALYLQEFVSRTPSWLHIDMMAWNNAARPGRPQGGEVMAARALFSLIKERYGN